MSNDAAVGTSSRSIAARVSRAALLVLALGAVSLVSACGSEGKLARDRQESMLESAMTDDAKVVVVEVFQNTAYVMVTETLLGDLRDVQGVMDARRGLGGNEAYALVKTDFDPQSIVVALERGGYRAKVVRVVTKASLAEEAKK